MRRSRFGLVSVFCAVTMFMVGLRPSRLMAVEDAIALLPLDVSGRLPITREGLEAEIRKGLTVADRPVLAGDEVAARLGRMTAPLACATAACWNRAGTALGVTYLLAGTVENSKGVFRVRFELVEVGGGRTLAVEENKCEAADCSVAELVRLSAREIVRKTIGRKETSPPPAPVAVAAPEPAPAAVTPAPVSQPADDEATPRWQRYWPYALSGVGVATAVTGGVLLMMDGGCVERCSSGMMPSRRVRETSTAAGWALLGTGVAAAAVGTVFLVRDIRRQREDRTTVGLYVAPGGAGVVGRF